MLTKSARKLIRSLATRKGRDESGLFVAEGPKLVDELWPRFRCHTLLVAASWAETHSKHLEALLERQPTECSIVADSEFLAASLQQSPQGLLALFRIPSFHTDPVEAVAGRLNLALDDVQDPGNLGTIVRLAAWFGVEDIWCSPATADIWSPKAVQASMGGLARVRVHYFNIASLLSGLPSQTPRYATVLDGQPLWQMPITQTGIIVMGNEGRGIQPEVQTLCNSRILIPSYPPGAVTTESLNVGMATAIVLAEFRRRATASNPATVAAMSHA